MKFTAGQKVVLSREGHRVIEAGAHRGKARTTGIIIGKSRTYEGCYNIKWKTRAKVELLHKKFISAASE